MWRRDPESNWDKRICNPLHNHFAISPLCADTVLETNKGKRLCFPSDLEREKRFELSTYTLARYRSTS